MDGVINPWIISTAVTALVVVLAAADSTIAVPVRGVMTRHLRFGPTELADLDRGKVVKHSIDTNTPGEIAVAGAVRVAAPKIRLLERVRDITRFKRGPDVLQIGRFSTPPSLQDLADLTIDRDTFDPRSCRVGDCNVRLSADAIRRFEHDVDAGAPDAQPRAAAWFKQQLLDSVQAYLSGSGTRMEQFDDDDKPVRPIDEFTALLNNAAAVGALVPRLPDHLAKYPAARIDGAEDFLYWAKQRVTVGPFITITHVTIVCPSDDLCVITSKDVYSSRYVDASLALTIASDVAGAGNAFYLVYANRSRANALKGRFSAIRRGLVERRARGSLDANLRLLKGELEKTP
jgi:hypothetical protein